MGKMHVRVLQRDVKRKRGQNTNWQKVKKTERLKDKKKKENQTRGKESKKSEIKSYRLKKKSVLPPY